MHAIFQIYGNKQNVDFVLEDLHHTKLPLKLWKGKKTKQIPMLCQIRYLPFGFYEFVFPREYEDIVLTALRFDQPDPYNIGKKILGINPLNQIRKVLKAEKIPKFKPTKGLSLPDLWYSIIPIGVRYDADMTEKSGPNKGWTHEAI